MRRHNSMGKVSMLQYILKLKLRLSQIMMRSIGNPTGTYEGHKKGGGGEDIIKWINLHLFYQYSFFSPHIFKTKLKLQF
jgi:hypothetical protein